METLIEEVDAETTGIQKSLSESYHASVPNVVNLGPQDNRKIKISCQLCSKTFKYRYFIRDLVLLFLMLIFFSLIVKSQCSATRKRCSLRVSVVEV